MPPLPGPRCKDCGRLCSDRLPYYPRADPTDTEPREPEYRCLECAEAHDDTVAHWKPRMPRP